VIVFQVLTRILAYIGKELVEVARRPAALASLVLGPFLIMAIFGLGYDNSVSPFQAELVVPASAAIFVGRGEATGRSFQNLFLAPVVDSAMEGKSALREWQFGPDPDNARAATARAPTLPERAAPV